MHATRAILAFGLLLTTGRVQAQTVPGAKHSAKGFAGCYRLILGPWSKVTPLGPHSPTEIVRLDTTSIDNGIDGSRAAARVAPADLARPTVPRSNWLRPPFWRLIGSDSLVIVTWSTGTEAEVFYGHTVGTELRGMLRLTSDARPMDPKTGRIMWDVWPWARATARRAACP